MTLDKTVLLVEDDVIDALTVKRAFADLGINQPIVHLSNGEDALDYLQSSPDAGPSVILLDINMPRMNGLEFLQALRADQGLQSLPVVVLTTSTNNHDIVKSFALNAAGYMIKPVDYQDFVRTIQTVRAYWQLSCCPGEMACAG